MHKSSRATQQSTSSTVNSDLNCGKKKTSKTAIDSNKKPRTSVRFCEEHLACKGKTEAQFQCLTCGSFQCEPCEVLIHDTLDFHERTRLVKPSLELLCESKYCGQQNYADVTCSKCKSNFCVACDATVHNKVKNGKCRRGHLRTPIQSVTAETSDQLDEETGDSEEFLSCQLFEEEDNVVANETEKTTVEQLIDIDLDSEGDASNCVPPSVSNAVRNSTAEHNQKKSKVKSGNSCGPSHITTSQPLKSLPDIAQLSLDSPFESPANSPHRGGSNSSNSTSSRRSSFLLVDENEFMHINTPEDFAEKLGCSPSNLVKVVSIFGNTGEGKSHTLNYTFFNGEEVYKTSPAQISCTIGIWCAYDPTCKVIAIDTEGLLGIAENNNRRTRLLLKVLAISDIIIYRTRAERLHNDLFTFLGDASRAYVQHFSKELRAASQRCNLFCPLSDLGPVVIIFHETVHTDILQNGNERTPEDIIRLRFNTLQLPIDAFSAFEYVGTRTVNPPTDFVKLQETVQHQLKNSTVRSARTPAIVFTALKQLNEKFNGDIDRTIPSTFPDEYFTCCSRCQSCDARCINGMNHARDGLPHKTKEKCKFQHQYNNQVYYCRDCYDRGDEIMIVPKATCTNESAWLGLANYAWSGYVLECQRCGVIYRSRQYWFGNRDPKETVARTEIQHVWPGEPIISQGSQNAAQRVLDSVNYFSEAVTSISAKPSKMIGSWVADQIAPSYWIPNHRITQCGICSKKFEELDQKHHCRACGGGFCEECSSKVRPVPDRGWGDQPVRVCDRCFEGAERNGDINNPVTARKVGEALTNTLGNVIQVIDYPLDWIKESARPDYWVPDKDIEACSVCSSEFKEKLAIHHCRSCGQGVCDECSKSRKPVPCKGWDTPVRVCDTCDRKL